MCAFNCEKYIERSISSILKQTYADFEFVIVLDAPTDKTREIVESIKDSRLKLIFNEQNEGLTRSLNIGLKHCSHEWVARQDADDLSLPTRFEKQMQFLSQNPNVVLVGSSTFLMDEGEKHIGVHQVPTTHQDIRWQMLFDNAFVHTSTVFKASIVRELGGYDESFKRTQDFDLWRRVSSRYQVANLTEPLVKYRHHPESISSKQSDFSNFYGDKIIAEHAKDLGLPKDWGKCLATIRHAKYVNEDIPFLRQALQILPSIKADNSVFIHERYPRCFEYISIKSAGVSLALSLSAYIKMLKASPISIIYFPYLKWILRWVSGVCGPETFEKLKKVKSRLKFS